jgi:hypothetical protein
MVMPPESIDCLEGLNHQVLHRYGLLNISDHEMSTIFHLVTQVIEE